MFKIPSDSILKYLQIHSHPPNLCFALVLTVNMGHCHCLSGVFPMHACSSTSCSQNVHRWNRRQTLLPGQIGTEWKHSGPTVKGGEKDPS